MRHRPDLDGLRAVAILAVLASHTQAPLTGGGWMGVDVFFVLSGFLITSLLLAEHARFGRVDVGRFYARRALRLYPALVVTVVVGAFFFRDLGDGGTLGGYARTAATSLLYLEDLVLGLTGHPHGALSHTWSLAVEEQFYLLWPLMLLLVVRRRWSLTAVALGLALLGYAALALSLGRSADGIPDAAYYLPWCRFPQLLVGCALAAHLHRRDADADADAAPDRSAAGGPVPPHPPRTPVRASYAGWVAAGAAVALVAAADRLGRSPHLWWQAPAIAVVTAVVLWSTTARPGSSLRRALAWPPAVWLGRRSYGVYLYHVPILVVLTAHLHERRAVISLLMLVLSVAAAAASYRWLEQPFLRLKTRLQPLDRAASDPVATP